MMTPVGALMIEHRLLERMITLMAAHLQRVKSQQTCDPVFIAAAVDFLREYADHCHHRKEEDVLFKALESKPLALSLRHMLRGLVADHAFTRETTSLLAQANERYRQGDAGALPEVATCLRALGYVYPRHITMEDREFFAPAQKHCDQQEQAAMLAQFREVDRQLSPERYRGVVEQWEAVQSHPR